MDHHEVTLLAKLGAALKMQVCARRLGLHHEHVLCASCRHLRELLGDAKRSEMLFYEHNGILADLSRQRITDETLSVSSSAWA